jgi:hypothetical protein
MCDVLKLATQGQIIRAIEAEFRPMVERAEKERDEALRDLYELQAKLDRIKAAVR